MKTITEIADENPGKADIWSLGKIAMFLALGSTDIDVRQLKNEVGEDLADFID